MAPRKSQWQREADERRASLDRIFKLSAESRAKHKAGKIDTEELKAITRALELELRVLTVKAGR